MELLRLYTALLRRRWLVVQAVLFFTLAAVVVSVVLPKNYKSSSRVLVSSSDATMSILSELGLSEVAQGLTGESDDITNKIQLATTRPVLEDIIWRLQLRDSDGKLYEPEAVLVGGFTGELLANPNVSITQQQGTDILVFEARADDPDLARLMADTHVRVSVQRAQERARTDTRSARIFIESQLTLVRDEFDLAMGEIADAKSAEEVLDLEAEMKAAIGRISELMMAYEQNAAAIQETRARLSEARAYQGRETASQVSPSTSSSNQRVAQLRDRIITLRSQRAEELTQKTEKHPDIARIDQLVTTAETELTAAIAEQHALDPGVHQLEAQLRGLVQKGAEIDAAIQRTTEAFSTYPDKLRRMSKLELAATAAESVYKSLQEQRFQIGVAEALLLSDLQLIEPAKVPDKHASPKVGVNALVGLAVGLMFGLGLVFLFEYIDDSVKTPEDLDEAWPALRLGVVPRFKLEGDRRVIDTLAATHPVAETYRTVRNGLRYASLDKPLTLLGVSSALPGEGKSTFTVNIAVSFAREGLRVLLVDCDLRRPAQHRHFKATSNHVGLTDVLTRQADVSSAIQDTGLENLWLLASGPTPSDPARLVESLRLRQLLLDLRKNYDMVLVDTPPALVVNDAMIIARAVDGMVLVVEAGGTSRKLVADLRGRFAAAGIDPVGIVLNKLDFFTSGYGHYAKAYQKYHDESAARVAEANERTSGGVA